MRILIIGGAGFIGSKFAESIKLKHLVTVYDNLSSGEEKNIPLGVKFKRGNTTDICTELADYEFDTIFHFGEYSRISTSFEDIDTVIKSNLYGTSQVIKYALKIGAKLIYSASSSKFGNNGDDENLSPYSWTKSKNIELIKNYNKWFNLKYEIAYFYNVYGAGEIADGKYATVLGIFKRQYENNYPLTIALPGYQKRCFTHIEDIVNGLKKIMLINYQGEWYLKANKSYTIVEVAKMFKTKTVFIPQKDGERFEAEVPNNTTQAILDWKPTHELKNYIELIINENNQ